MSDYVTGLTKRAAARKFIIGTDWWDDCDDVVAMRLFAWGHKNGLIDIQGVGINACMEYSCASLGAFFHAEGLPDIPIGIDFEATDYGGNPPYQKRMAALPSKYGANRDCEEAVRLYRRLLAAADAPVEIAEIGFAQVLANTLKSGADDISAMTGMELFGKKVKKLWMMAGKWDDPNGGRENNFCRTLRTSAAAHELCKSCPSPITFLGFEVATGVLTGQVVKGWEDDCLAGAMRDHGSEDGRQSWDPMLALLAVTGDEERAGYAAVRGSAHIDAQTGANYFTREDNGKHCYVVKTKPDLFYQSVINEIILL